jgi:hypothetical protein
MQDHLQLYPLQGGMSFLDSQISGCTTAATSKGSTETSRLLLALQRYMG